MTTTKQIIARAKLAGIRLKQWNKAGVLRLYADPGKGSDDVTIYLEIEGRPSQVEGAAVKFYTRPGTYRVSQAWLNARRQEFHFFRRNLMYCYLAEMFPSLEHAQLESEEVKAEVLAAHAYFAEIEKPDTVRNHG